ncbi:hypothetical protein ACKWTF_010389 [Chironomus riparius]
MAKKKVKLNENDCKNTLSSQKKPKQPKTVLINNVTDYWPALNEQKVTELHKILESFTSDKSNEKEISIGLESAIRNVKNKTVRVLFIADEISPQWFGKHLIAMSLTIDPETKILIVPKLKEMTKKILNVPSIIWCIKKEVPSINAFYSSLSIHEELKKHYYTVRPNKDVSITRKKIIKEVKEVPIVYLKKSSDSVPAFRSTADKMEFEDSLDFISLAKYDDPALVNKKSPFPSYRPLKVKKVIGNKDRESKNS